MFIDSGAAENIINEITNNRLEPKRALYAADIRIFAYGSKDAVILLDSFETGIRYKEKAVIAVLHVTKSNGGSYNTASQLELIASNVNTLTTLKIE